MVWDGWTVAERTADLEGLTWYLNNTKFTHKDLEEQEKVVNGEKKEMENITREDAVKLQKGGIFWGV